jgi:hypothetical protein
LAGAGIAVLFAVAATVTSHSGDWALPDVVPDDDALFIPSLALLAIVAGYAVNAWLVEAGPLPNRPTRAFIVRLGLIVALVIAMQIVYRALSVPNPKESNYFRSVFWLATTRPLAGLVAHAAFFGPITLLIMLRWRALVRFAGSLGTGAGLLVGLALLLAVDSESRHFLNLLPLLTLCAVATVDRGALRSWHVAVFGALSLVTSKVWLRIGEFAADGTYAEFPAQRMYMNLGPWMAPNMYLLQGAVAVVALAVGAAWVNRIAAVETS